MPSEPVQVVTYDDFSGGEYSELNQMAAPNQFHGTNVMVYANGMIGPRPGLRDITPTNMPDGYLKGLETTRVGSRGGVFMVDDDVYYFDLFNPFVDPTLIDNFDTNPTVPVKTLLYGSSIVFASVDDDKTYQINVGGAASVVGLTDSPGGTTMEIYGERMVIAGQSSNRRRVYFSDAADYNSWPVENFFNVGDDTQTTALQLQRQHLTIYKSFGIFVLTGVPGVNAVLRQVSRTEGPLWDWQTVVDEDDMSWFLPTFRNNPTQFNGTGPEQIGYLKEILQNQDGAPFGGFPMNTGMVELKGDKTGSSIVVMMRNGVRSETNRMVINHNGIWTIHHAEVDISGLLAKAGPIVIATDGGAPSEGALIYSMELGLQRPPFEEDNTTSPGDGGMTPPVASFNMPEFWSEDGQDMTIRRIDVDFVKWDIGTGDLDITNHFEIRTEALGYENNDGRYTSNTYTFDQAQSEAAHTLAGTPDRFIARLGDDSKMAPGFQLFVENIRGCWIRRIKVWCEMHPNVSRY